MSGTPVEVAVDSRSDLGEGPSWDAREGILWWVDITSGVVHRYDPASRRDTMIDVGQPVGAVVPRRSGGLALATRDGFAVMDPGTRHVELIAPVEQDLADNLMNDAKCDDSGRLWAGTMAFDSRPHAGALYRLDRDHSVTRVLDSITCSNGLGWSLDGTLMYYIDSGKQQVDVLDFDAATGEPANRRRLLEIPAGAGIPDGMAVDAEGCLWIALWGGSAVRRYTPDGRLDRVLELAVSQVTSCVFGGDDLSDLYVTSAAGGLSEDELRRYPHSGSLFVHRPGVRGRPTIGYVG